MKKEVVVFSMMLLFSIVGEAQISIPFNEKKEVSTVTEKDYMVDGQNNIVVSKIIENINGEKMDIFVLAKQYLIDAYDETKYEIIEEDLEGGTIIGEGVYNKFFSMNIFPNTFYLNATFKVKIDSKDGRARISLFVHKYSGQRINGNIVENLSDNVADFQPVNTKNGDKKKLYNKAFPVLIGRMEATISKIEDAITNGISSTYNDNW